ncbi:hypothetical protein ACIQNU_03955 [Streptomyces sp. NPDC091292]|uniref:hypothetical protein n=1 Tax=Streptomyces sp. NPDC091292 TaxID=3365991 RepID=UPI00381ABAB6
MATEARSDHTRKASAGRRRRHTTQLPHRIAQIAPDAASILLMSMWTDSAGPAGRKFLAVARAGDGTQLPLPPGGSRDIASLVQGAFPTADWNRTQTWYAATNTLTPWQADQSHREAS